MHRTALALPSLRRSAAVLTIMVAVPACLGGGMGEWDPVDEDFSRPSPLLSVDGAISRSCADKETFQRDLVFQHALCLCGDLQDVGQGLVTRSNSQAAGADSGLGHVGINGGMEVVGDFDVNGTLDVAGGLQGVGNLNVRGDLVSGDDVETTGSWDVGGDAWIDGDLSCVGSIDIGEDLYLTGDFAAVGSVDYTLGHRGFAYRGDPCGCGPNEIIDVAAEVASHRNDNNNASLPGGVGSRTLLLTTGAYYFSDPGDFVGATSVTVQGRVSVYVEGDIDSVGDLDISIEEGGELSLWVSGTISTVGNLNFAASGDERPRAFKLYMGGRGSSLVSVGSAAFVGAVYAPEVDIEYVGSLDVRGSLFANNLSGTGDLTVTYDTDVPAPATCVDEYYRRLAE